MSTRTAIVCLLALCCAAPVAAQAPFATELLSSAGPLTAQQQAEVAAFTDDLAKRLDSATSQDALAIRSNLQSLLKDPSVRVAFRRELGAAFIKSFEPIAGGSDGGSQTSGSFCGVASGAATGGCAGGRSRGRTTSS